jgi:hypothetical protein
VSDNVFRFRPPAMGQTLLFLDDRPAVRVPVKFQATMPPKLQPREWCLYDGYIYFAVELAKLPADYKLTYASLPTGITLYHVDHVVIKDLTIQGFRADGITAQNTARWVILTKVTTSNNSHSGISVGAASQVELDSCTLSGNTAAQLLTLPYSETHVYDSELPGKSSPGWVDQGGHVFLADKAVRGGLDNIKREDAKRKNFPKNTSAEKKPDGDLNLEGDKKLDGDEKQAEQKPSDEKKPGDKKAVEKMPDDDTMFDGNKAKKDAKEPEPQGQTP